MSDPAKNTPKKKRKLSKRRLILISVLAVMVLIFGTVGGIVLSFMAQTPPFDPKVLTTTDQSSTIYDKDGNQIGILHAAENRQIADSKEIPDKIKEAFVTVEDIRFYKHFGVDPIGIARALYKDLTGGDLEGASTITIQLARNAFLNQEQSLKRKVMEATLAMKLERLYTKDEILTFYLNRVFFGESAYGIKTAAKTYFNKSLDQLDMGEIAMLVGIVKGPSIYDPFINPDQAKSRRATVLQVLRDNKIISEEDFEKFKEAPFAYVDQVKKENKNPQAENQPTVNISYKFPYFVDFSITELQNYGISTDKIYSGGLKIYTTVDSKIQGIVENAYADPKNFPRDIDGQPVQSAMVIMDPKDGSIRAMVGGRNYRTAKDLNRAWQSVRQPGSSIKPLVDYAPALEKGGYFPGTVLDNMPVKYKGGDGKTWAPTNFESNGWTGLTTMREGLRNSINIYAIKLLDRIGIDYGWQFAKEKFGLGLHDNDRVLSLALGTAEVSLLDMVSAYSAFPTGGVKADRHAILKVYDSKGTLLVDNTNVKKQRILSEQTAFLMNDMLRGVVTGGTGTAAQFGNWFIAGKTGTTSFSDNQRGAETRDIWFMGYTMDYVGGAWMGFDQSTNRRNMKGYFGGGPTAKLWRKVMSAVHEGLPVISKIPKPSGLSYITYDTKSGLTPSSLTPSQFIARDYAISGKLPSGTSDVWTEMEVCADTGLLPGPNTVTKVTKVFLNVNRDGINVAWPSSEAPFKPPTETCNMPPAGPPPPSQANLISDLKVKVDKAKKTATLTLQSSQSILLKITVNGPAGYSTKVFNASTAGAGSHTTTPIDLPIPGRYTFTLTASDPVEPDITTTLTAEASIKG